MMEWDTKSKVVLHGESIAMAIYSGVGVGALWNAMQTGSYAYKNTGNANDGMARWQLRKSQVGGSRINQSCIALRGGRIKYSPR